MRPTNHEGTRRNALLNRSAGFNHGCTRINTDDAFPMWPRACTSADVAAAVRRGLFRRSYRRRRFRLAPHGRPRNSWKTRMRKNSFTSPNFPAFVNSPVRDTPPTRSAFLTADVADKADEADQPRRDTKERAPEALRGGATTNGHENTRMRKLIVASRPQRLAHRLPRLG